MLIIICIIIFEKGQLNRMIRYFWKHQRERQVLEWKAQTLGNTLSIASVHHTQILAEKTDDKVYYVSVKVLTFEIIFKTPKINTCSNHKRVLFSNYSLN